LFCPNTLTICVLYLAFPAFTPQPPPPPQPKKFRTTGCFPENTIVPQQQLQNERYFSCK
jgi:hypothetical protein